ncbi:MAG: ABC-type multidrug transport system, ATPase component [Candidatus Nomurabacteria bacterium GW2011_GWF2_35_66]|uniref:ABC-type multidrug transport system, ATPase component n=1 Tax=Candidatus Nomurabacteria bacterium GW2011_GWE1_35_16 TaxID=1618761 RepID=A0A0G0DSU8_9BACT|nr:MAG: ABC-type multidrug transport system, ATPase component [Candidatus Nomurabacteria bacterium GW2011_GWF1_34_20]KKP62089.1 MAG: ABC-type multidrug transport system, ATPase component [Candidatus Nomurabacteria bacterium GW2011_GWE2_34_25]KKP66055.1 MAG: ABC-type multidrug transport system, ATPase component [Candidatus Nomurabacteria bacterium GW2011_GWE1_35_16]KKP83039.1 MAG: ABC-type multidrug transport system, ATPase component [Candidatus Nomurabacteria bacterium GW2011_GWF2_35_66]HAE3696
MDKEKDYNNLHRGLVLKYFWEVIRQYKISFFVVIFTIILVSIMDVYIPFQFLKLFNIFLTNDFSFVKQAQHIFLFIFVLKIISWGLRRTIEFTNFYFVSHVEAGLREQAFSSMMKHSKSFFSNNFSGSLTQKINKYIRAFEKLNDRLVRDGIALVIKSIGTVTAIYILLPKYSYILGIFCFVFLLTAMIYTRLKLKYDIIAALADTKTHGSLADSISNHPSVQFFAGHEYENERITKVVGEQQKATIFNWNLWGGLGTIQGLYILIVEFVIFWIAIGDWKLGLIGLPVIVLIQTYIYRLIENLWDFASITKAFYEAFADAQEMALVMEKPYDIKDEVTNELKNVKGEVVFENVTYIYDKNNTKVFDNFSLTIPAGQKLAIVGTSGAGKSTFVNLLMRLFNLTSGKIMIDGVDIATVSQKNLREEIGFVPQDPALFHRSLLENIRYGRRDATDEEVKEASRLANCDKFIDRLPLGYDTYVGERGIKLSGGERQRVAIARAILKDAPILVLDEATSALDSESEMLIQEALHNLIKNKTTIVIAHRLSTVRAMDRIIVIEDGKIIEDDNHDELLNNKDGIYKKLWDIQSGGFDTTE